MLKYQSTAKTLEPISTTTLQQAHILERADLQEAIVTSWDAFCEEIGLEELFLVGTEIIPHNSCANRIDILALSRDGVPFVFELKRHRNRLQLLQALSYAAMVANWNQERYLDALAGKVDEQSEELRSLLEDDGFELGTPEIVLIAESFDPEVILTSDWLAEFEIPISAFAITAVTHKGETLLAVDQKFPLLGLDDVYVKRNNGNQSTKEGTTWEQALEKVDFSFAARAVKIFTKQVQGSPHRRAFFYIYASSPIGRLDIRFRRSYLKVYTKVQSPEAEKALRDNFGTVIPINAWGNENTKNKGFTFTIETEEQFETFLAAVNEA